MSLISNKYFYGEFMKVIIKTLVVTLLFVYVCSVSAQDKKQSGDKSKSNVIVKYDKKKNLTTVRLKELRISKLILEKQASKDIPLHQTDLEIFYTYQGEKSTEPVAEINFRFYVSARNYIFLRSQTVMAALDSEDKEKGRAIMLGNTDYKSEPPKFNTVYEEFMVVKVPSEALKKMAEANSLEIYLGPISYPLTTEQLAAIRELADFLPESDSKS